MRHEIIHGDNMDVLPTLPADSIDSMVTDPPAGIAFMGKAWDSHSRYEPRTVKGKAVLDGATLMGLEPWEAGFVSFTTDWSTEAYRVLKPGAHALVWALPRTSDLTELGLRAAGFEIRDVVTHLFGSGFPKSLDASKAIDDFLGAKRPVVGEKEQRNPYIGSDGLQFRDAPDYTGQLEAITAPGSEQAARFDGWGTALKPASEHWILCRKPLGEDTVASNILKHGTGAINIDGCRVVTGEFLGRTNHVTSKFIDNANGAREAHERTVHIDNSTGLGRWPSNLVLTHHPDCQRTGTKKVPGGSGWATTGGSKSKGGILNQTEGVGAREWTGDHTDADGMETVDAWFCAPGCPVYELDLQSGTLKSGAKKAGFRNGMGYHGAKGEGMGEASEVDEGGASRFFPQFAWTDDDMNAALFMYCAKASRGERNKGLDQPQYKLRQDLTPEERDWILSELKQNGVDPSLAES